MNRRLPVLVTAAFAFAAGFLPVAAAGQSYGTGDQVLTLGPMAFRGRDSTLTFLTASDGYLYGYDPSFELYVAPLTLPDGAEIFQMCVYGNVTSDGYVNATIQSVKLVPGGQSSSYVDVPGSEVVDTIQIGYGTVCTNPFSYVFHDTNENFENIAHDIRIWTSYGMGVGGVRIFWRRQVSDPPPVSSFDDVPLGSTFSKFIEALKAAGITAGCQSDPPLFCPDRPITRAEMATYLSIALGLHWPN
jgi:hypothetical protein